MKSQLLPTALYRRSRRPEPVSSRPAWRRPDRLFDPDLTVVDTAPTVETRLPEARVQGCRALVPYRGRPAPVPARPPAPRPAPADADLSGFFSACEEDETRELEPPAAADRSRGVGGFLDRLIEKRLWLAVHSVTVLVVGIVVGLMIGNVV
jgi:hypothetical protein